MRLNRVEVQVLNEIAQYVKANGQDNYYNCLQNIIDKAETFRIKYNVISAKYKRKKRAENRMFARSKKEKERLK